MTFHEISMIWRLESIANAEMRRSSPISVFVEIHRVDGYSVAAGSSAYRREKFILAAMLAPDLVSKRSNRCILDQHSKAERKSCALLRSGSALVIVPLWTSMAMHGHQARPETPKHRPSCSARHLYQLDIKATCINLTQVQVVSAMSVLNISSSLKARSDVEPIDSSLVPLFVSELITGQYFNLALATALIYHSIITVDQEIKYFWPKPRSAVSVIYFANRYIGILAALCEIPLNCFTETITSCQFAFWTGSLANKITIVLIDYILLIRVSALWNQDKKLSIILKILLGLGFGLSLGILIYGKLAEELVVGRLAEGVTVCAYDGDPPRILSIVSWLVPTIYGLILLCLALYKATEYWKLSAGFKGFRLVRVLIQDQVLYYGLVIFCTVCKIVDLVMIDINPAVSDILNVAGSPTLLCILGGQLLINLKEAGERGANAGTNYTPKISDIDFGENGANDEQLSVHQGSV